MFSIRHIFRSANLQSVDWQCVYNTSLFSRPLFSVLSVVLQHLLHDAECNPVSIKVSCGSRSRRNLFSMWFMNSNNQSMLYENSAAWKLMYQSHASNAVTHIHTRTQNEASHLLCYNQTSTKVTLKHIKGIFQISINHICSIYCM